MSATIKVVLSFLNPDFKGPSTEAERRAPLFFSPPSIESVNEIGWDDGHLVTLLDDSVGHDLEDERFAKKRDHMTPFPAFCCARFTANGTSFLYGSY